MDAMISKAVIERRLLHFTYKGKARTVEPHTYGRQHSGTDAICAWQESGGSGVGYRLFIAGEMSSISVGSAGDFDQRPGYHRGDQKFAVIYAEL